MSGAILTRQVCHMAMAHPLLWNGIKPVFVDVDPNTLNPDPARIEAAITPQTTVIMPVHCYTATRVMCRPSRRLPTTTTCG